MSDHLTRPSSPASKPSIRGLLVAIWPAVLVLLTLALASIDTPRWIFLALLALTACTILLLLWHLYRVIGASAYGDRLGPARLHLLLHCVPLALILLYFTEASAPWIAPMVVLSLVAFFASGRRAWLCLKRLFPSSLLYELFRRGNSAFLTSFPLLYIASLALPDFVTFATIKTVALFYFSIHFMMLGIASLKIQSDLMTLDPPNEIPSHT